MHILYFIKKNLLLFLFFWYLWLFYPIIFYPKNKNSMKNQSFCLTGGLIILSFSNSYWYLSFYYLDIILKCIILQVFNNWSYCFPIFPPTSFFILVDNSITVASTGVLKLGLIIECQRSFWSKIAFLCQLVLIEIIW